MKWNETAKRPAWFHLKAPLGLVDPVVRILALITIFSLARTGAQDVPYGVGDWPQALGNHRAHIRVEKRADAVWVHLPWRRRDAAPERIEVIVMDAATSNRLDNVLRVNIQRQFGDLLFQPATVPGDYYIYYLPNKSEGSWYCPTTVYTPPSDKARPEWSAACKSLAERVRAGDTAGIPEAKVLEFQAINAFHSFYPMEVVASAEETKAVLAAHPGRPYLLFPEDRKYPIRMTDELPLRWIRSGPGEAFTGDACRGEFYSWQVGWYASGQEAEEVAAEFSDLTSPSGRIIPASAQRCINLGGTDWLGRPLHKKVNVAQGRIQALWFGVAVPRDATPGTYRGIVTLRAKNAPATPVTLTLNVSDKILEDGGDGELWRQSRLRWLDSTIGLDDEVFPPYTPVAASGKDISVLGRAVRLADTGLFSSITTSFTPNVDGIGGPAREILAEPMRLVARTDGGAPLTWRGDGARIVNQASGAVTWEAASTAGSLELLCRAKMECDGYVNFWLTLKCGKAARLDDVRLEIPVRREIAKYMMGLGRKGGHRPARWDWKWDIARANNQLWIGDVDAGLSCKLKHITDRWDIFNLKETGLYKDWANGGAGGCVVEEAGADQVVIRAYTGPREVAAGTELHFNFGLLVTPVKVLDKDHWQWRYFHAGSAGPVAEAAARGATVINIHQGGSDGLNPYINYPFLTADKLAAYAAEAHARKMKLKVYYTVRELSDYTAELWALRSLGDEIYSTGPGFRLADQFADKPAVARKPTGGSWLCEHLVNDYVPAWHQPLGNGRVDAAIATAGLSRWHNYYLEGLNWLVQNAGIDGLYLDGIGYDREIMKRVRKVLQRGRPGSLIDFHSGNNFYPEYGLGNCANEFMELFPFIDSLWFGEGFNYNEPPDYWLVEVAGIPYGLFGEMMGTGNPWRGMVYGMTGRQGWGGGPREMWKVWDDFGIAQARMIGYWDAACPVKTGREDVPATAYQREGRTLVSLASWATNTISVPLGIDFPRLGLDQARAHLYAPRIPGFQREAVFNPGDAIPVEPGRGWLLVVDEQAHQVSPAAELYGGRRELVTELFSGSELGKGWTAVLSKAPGTAIHAGGGELRIEAPSGVSAYVERVLPSGARLLVCHIDQRTDQGTLWGPGLALVWPDGNALRVNQRADGRFQVDHGAKFQAQDNPGHASTQLAVLLDDKEVVVQACPDGKPCQELARFPRSEFPGDPKFVRVGKMSPGSKNEDSGSPGSTGVCAIKEFRVLGN